MDVIVAAFGYVYVCVYEYVYRFGDINKHV